MRVAALSRADLPNRPRQSRMPRRAFLRAAIAVPILATPSLATGATDRVVAAYYPPLMIDDAARPGLSIEILQHAARRAGRRLDIAFLPFARALKTLQRRPDHLMPAFFRNPTREPHYSWIAQTHVEHLVFNTLGPIVDTLEQARRLPRIGVESNAAMDVLLSTFGFENIVRTTSPLITSRQLLSGHIDAWALTRTVSAWTWSALGYRQTLVQGATVGLSDVYLAASRTVSADLAGTYAAALDELHRDGTVRAVLDRYGA